MPRDDLRNKEDLQELFTDWVNYFVIALILVAPLAIGLYFWWRGHANTDEYFFGGRSMTALPVTLSLVTSNVSAVTLLGVPSWTYMAGTHYATVVFSVILIIWLASKFYLPVFARLNLATVYEYLELRFSSKMLRSLVSLYFAFSMMMYQSVSVVAPSIALAQVTAMKEHLWCAIIFAVCGIYTCLGGIKAVMWTDAFQFFVMFGSFVAVAWVGTNDERVGSAGEIFKRNYESGRVQLFNFDFDPRINLTVWTTVIGNAIVGLHVFGACHTSVQRFTTCKNADIVRKVTIGYVFGTSALTIVCVYMGMLIFAFYYDCDPIQAQQVEKPDQLLPLFVMQVMGNRRGMPGLMVAGLLCGTLSTVSSGLNSIAAVCLEDGFISYGYLKGWTDRRKVLLIRCTACVLCVISYLLSFLFHVPSIMTAAVSILGLVAGPILGVYTLGMFFPAANRIGAITGFLTSFALQCWMFVGRQIATADGTIGCTLNAPKLPRRTDKCPSHWEIPPAKKPLPCDHLALYDVSFFWHAGIGLVCVIVVGLATSIITGQKKKQEVDCELIVPHVHSLFSLSPSAS